VCWFAIGRAIAVKHLMRGVSMESAMPVATKIAQARSLFVLRGIVSILFGIGALAWPGITIVFLVAFVGAYLFIDGVIAIVSAIRARHERERWPMLLLEGILGIAVGIYSFIFPGIAAVSWLYVIAAWAIITGVLQLATAFRLRKALTSEWFLVLGGLASIVLGILFVLMPLAGLFVWVWLIGIYAIVFGVLFLGLAWRLGGVARATPAAHA
jgi:uncharacterized membrane protein HdeD (DUF308 family)